MLEEPQLWLREVTSAQRANRIVPKSALAFNDAPLREIMISTSLRHNSLRPSCRRKPQDRHEMCPSNWQYSPERTHLQQYQTDDWM